MLFHMQTTRLERYESRERDINTVTASPNINENRLGEIYLIPETWILEPGPEEPRATVDTKASTFNQNVALS